MVIHAYSTVTQKQENETYLKCEWMLSCRVQRCHWLNK